MAKEVFLQRHFTNSCFKENFPNSIGFGYANFVKDLERKINPFVKDITLQYLIWISLSLITTY